MRIIDDGFILEKISEMKKGTFMQNSSRKAREKLLRNFIERTGDLDVLDAIEKLASEMGFGEVVRLCWEKIEKII